MRRFDWSGGARALAWWITGAALTSWGAACGSNGDDGVFGDGAGAGIGADCGQCPGSMKCDGDLGCVECTLDIDCGTAQPHCVAGECVQCDDNADCATGESCFPRDHECHPSCSSDADCMNGGEGNAELCDTTTGACIECSTDAQCDQDELCNPTFGQCSECATSADCPAAQPFCDLPQGNCRECLHDGHCDGTEVCSDHECVSTSCAIDADCGEDNPHCEVGTGSCFECLDDAHCTDGGQPFCSPQHECVECLLDEHCEGNSGGSGGSQQCDDEFQCQGG